MFKVNNKDTRAMPMDWEGDRSFRLKMKSKSKSKLASCYQEFLN